MTFIEADLPKIEKRIFAWASVYYEAISDIIRRYPDPNDSFPESMQLHSRQVRLIISPGYFTFRALQSDETWTAKWQDAEPLSSEFLESFKVRSQIDAFTRKGQQYRISAFLISADKHAPRPAPWEKLIISNTGAAKRWTADNARAEASNDVLSFTIDRLLGSPSQEVSEGIQSNPHKVVAGQLQRLTSDFGTLLSDASREEELQLFIREHPYLLDLRAISIDPKVPLGSEYVTDFVVKLPGSQYLLVEIEKSTHALYTNSYNPTAALTHAVRQVEDWLEWSYENLSYLRSRYPDIHEPKGLVILGRRSSLNHKTSKALRRRNVLSKVQVATYDDLIDDMKAIASNLERGTIPTSTGVAYN
jgi:hypothetical protein